jgi:hypothetical protein
VKNEKVQLTDEQKKYLVDFVSKGMHNARAIRRAKTLLLLSQGTLEQKHIAAQTGTCAWLQTTWWSWATSRPSRMRWYAGS